MKRARILVVAAVSLGALSAPAFAGFKQCQNKMISVFCLDKGYTTCWDTAPSAACCSTDKTGEARDCAKPGVRVAMRDGVKVTFGHL